MHSQPEQNENVLWQASPARRQRSHLFELLNTVNVRYQLSLETYEQLHAWSIEHLSDFWQCVWDFAEFRSATPVTSVLQPAMPGAHWFEGATLNFAEFLLRTNDNSLAIIASNESGQTRHLTYHELHQAVAACQAGLVAAGIQAGDRVVGLLPNIPETVIAMLATTSLGAIWSACSPDFGQQAILDRFVQIEPKLLFTTDGAQYAGKIIDTAAMAIAVCEQLPDCMCVIIPYLHRVADTLITSGNVKHYAEFIDHTASQCQFAPFDFAQPVYIVYTSGTTGAPKCITHGAGGVLLQHMKELMLHTDIHHGDVVFYYTTCGWMMWHWLVSSLAVGATVVLYDGSPLHPSNDVLMDLIDTHQINVFGASAKYYAALAKNHCSPMQTHDLGSLQTLLSTGSPLLPEQFDYIYQAIKADVCLSSISGGTDLLSCFALGCPLKPVIRGQLQCIGLGMDVAVFDETGAAIENKQGELVCRQPFPSMPIYFWQDANNTRYHESYFSRFPGVWAHGDYAQLSNTHSLILYGRADATINPGGVRIGTAEIYATVEHFDEIIESLCVGRQHDGDEDIILFVVMRAKHRLSSALQEKLKQAIRTQISPHHVPHHFFAVSALPRTISGKLVELTVKRILQGQAIDNRDALANPEVLTEFENIAKEFSN